MATTATTTDNPANYNGTTKGTTGTTGTTGATGTAGTGNYGYGNRPGLFRHDSQAARIPRFESAVCQPGPTWDVFTRSNYIDVVAINAIVGMALAVGGLCQLLAGMWEFVVGNTFAATAFTIMGGFYMSLGIFLWPSSGSMAFSSSHLGSAIGIYFMVWMIVTLFLFIGTLRGSIPLAVTFFFLFLMFMLLGISNFMSKLGVRRAGGIIGCIASMVAFYTGAIGLHNRDTTYFDVPAMGLGRRGVNDPAAPAGAPAAGAHV
ncbi:GPR1/FUN34/yaaH family protein [Ceratobasidium theobromae]|uniref:GPR1/FUN34/yaaH family protein n=1 Tax=Ceratobasidium theobromae TaxID=1582974 RepID=A0A5N5QCE3_9AGAM|nr:GPR1/FUN34/yaaH family protein [Ceratobasidium theobromae]